MMRRRVGMGIAVAGVGAALTVLPVAPALASGHSGLCGLSKSNEAAESKATASVTKAIESGNWASAQSALLSSFNSEDKAQALAIAALSGAPSNVRAAGAVMLRFAGTEKKIIQSSTSAAQFESGVESASQNPKIVNAEKLLASYFTTKCGSVTSTT